MVFYGIAPRGDIGKDRAFARPSQSRTMKSNGDTIHLGIVGLGWPGHRHAEAIAATPGARLVACADLGEQRREEFARVHRPDKVYVEYDELLADPDVDAVIVGLPNYLHFPATMSALAAGKHVLCEKPPTLHAADMRKVRARAKSDGLVYSFGRQARFDGRTIVARRLIESGRLGNIYFARALFVRSRGIPVGIGGWFLDKSKAGGGALIDLGVHAIDTAWYLMGCPKAETVSGSVFQHFGSLVPERMHYDVEDSAYGQIRFEGGAALHFEVSWAANLPDDIPSNAQGKREAHNTIVYGDAATIRLSPFSLFENTGDTIRDTRLEGAVGSNFAGQMANFVDAIRTGQDPVNSVDQAVDLMDMLEAVYRSSKSGREVVL